MSSSLELFEVRMMNTVYPDIYDEAVCFCPDKRVAELLSKVFAVKGGEFKEGMKEILDIKDYNDDEYDEYDFDVVHVEIITNVDLEIKDY